MTIPTRAIPACLLLAAAGLACGCASSQPQTATARLDLQERAVDARADNAAVLESTTEGLVVQLAIDGDRVEVTDVQVLRVPKAPRRAMGEGMIAVTALRGGDEVYATAVPDEELNALEEGGLVRLTERSITFTLPTGTPVTALRVQLGPEAEARRLDLAPRLGDWCRGDQAQERAGWAEPWCRAAREAGEKDGEG